MLGERVLTYDEKPILDVETYEDYLFRIERPKRKADSGDRWSPKQEQDLVALVQSDSSQVEIAAAFPYRKWVQIRIKITKLCGKVQIKGVGKIKRNETYYDYLRRVNQDDDPSSNDGDPDNSTAEYDVSERESKNQQGYPNGSRDPLPLRHIACFRHTPQDGRAGGARARQSPVR